MIEWLLPLSAIRLPGFSPYGQIYILCFIQCRNLDLIQWRAVAIRTVWCESPLKEK